jgi:ribosomal protein S18 acetylase RimI-like enzyme
MDENYYRLFGLPQAAVEALLVGLLRDPASEFGTAAFLLRNGSLAGFVSAFPSEQMFARRAQVLRALLGAAPDPAVARQRLQGFDGAGRKLPPNSFYLAKLYLAPPLRGSGLADRLLERFVGAGKRLGRWPCLHVRRENAVALALYRRHGFKGVADPTMSSSAYVLMDTDQPGPAKG